MIGVVSQVLGLVAGLGLALILIYVINVQSFGWTIQFHLPGLFLLQSSLALFVATALAGLYPARLAAAGAAGGAPRRMRHVRSAAVRVARGVFRSRGRRASSTASVAQRGARARPAAARRSRQPSRVPHRVVVLHRQPHVHGRPPLRLPADVLPGRRRSRARQSRRAGPCATCSWRTSRSPTSAAGGTGPSRSSAGPGWGGPAPRQTAIACGTTTGACSCRTAGIA